jgi:uncharacterized membrane protein
MPATLPSAPTKGFLTHGIALLIRFLLVGAAIVASYLLWVSFRGIGVIGCGSGSGCQELLRSRWAYWLGLPVSLGGLAMYLALFVATFWLRVDAKAERRRIVWQVVAIPCAIVVIGAGVWFGLLQLIVLKRFCPFCTAAHGCAVLAAVGFLAQAPLRQRTNEDVRTGSKAPDMGIGPAKPGLVAAVILGGLIGGQIAYRPPTQRVQPVAGVQKVTTPGASHEIAIFDGKFRIDLQEVPMLGRPDAAHVVVSLLDYTCYACRILHAQLAAAQGVFSNQLGVVILPMPLDRTCNPTVTEVFPAHSNACEYARIGLAVWRANRSAFTQFEGWVFSSPEVPAVGDVRQVAERLVGPGGLKMEDPWINEQIRRDVAIYETTYSRIKNHSMPQMIVGTNLVFGNFANMDDLFRLLRDQFGLSQSR